MVQFFDLGQSTKARTQEEMGKALGAGIGDALREVGEYKRERGRLQEALGSLNNIDPESIKNVSPSERFSVLHQALAPHGKYGAGILNQVLNIEKQRASERESNVLARAAQGEKLEPSELSSLSPNTQLKLLDHYRRLQAGESKANQDKSAGQKFSSGYNAILNGDTESLKSIIEDEETPLPVKQQLSGLKNQYDTRKSVESRELRNRQNLVINAYNKAITSESNRLKTARLKERPAIEESIQKLKKLLQKDMRRLVKNPESYGNLSIWDTDAGRYLPEGQEEGEDVSPQAGEPSNDKVKFDQNNPEHKAKAQQLYKQYKDKEKVREMLSKEFEGL